MKKILISILCLNAFIMPFGMWQEHILGGLSGTQILLPILALLYSFHFFKNTDRTINYQYFWIFYTIFFLLTLPTLIFSEVIGVQQVILLAGYAAQIFLVFNICQTTTDVRNVILAYSYGLTIVLILSVLALFKIYDAGSMIGQPMLINVTATYRLAGTELNPNAFAVYLLIGLPAFIYLHLTERIKMMKWLWIALALLTFAALTITVSRAAFLGGLIAVTAFLILKDRLTLAKATLLMLLIPSMLLPTLYLPHFIKSNAQYLQVKEAPEEALQKISGSKKKAAKIRLEFLPVALDIIKENPLTGIENAQLPQHLAKYEIRQKTPHNIILDLAISFGLPCAIAFVIFIAAILLKLTINVLKEKDKEIRALQALTLSIVVGMLINGMFHSTHFNSLTWLFIAAACASIHLNQPRKYFALPDPRRLTKRS